MSAIDPKTTAIVCVDLQNGIVALSTAPHTSDDIVSRSALLVEKYRAAGSLVVYVTVGNSVDGGDALSPTTDGAATAGGASRPADWADLDSRLSRAPNDVSITKRQWGAFYGTELDLQLRRRCIRTLILTGIATNVGVESTARDAFERGFDQIFVEDAMASTSGEAHAMTCRFTFPRIGLLRTADEVLALI